MIKINWIVCVYNIYDLGNMLLKIDNMTGMESN